MTYHCQICGQTVRASNGKVGAHPHPRPGFDERLLAGCPGAGWRPVEVACDAMIEEAERSAGRTQRELHRRIRGWAPDAAAVLLWDQTFEPDQYQHRDDAEAVREALVEGEPAARRNDADSPRERKRRPRGAPDTQSEAVADEPEDEAPILSARDAEKLASLEAMANHPASNANEAANARAAADRLRRRLGV